MIDVTNDWWIAIAIAVGGGAFGGLVYELIQARFSDAGMVERMSKQQNGSRRYLDLGLWASVIVGGVAATAFLYFFPPSESSVTEADVTVVTREYDALKLVAVSLIIGSAGGSFLTSMQERVKALIAGTQLAEVKKNVDNLVATAKSTNAATGQPQIESPGSGTAPTAEPVISVLDSIQAIVRRGGPE